MKNTATPTLQGADYIKQVIPVVSLALFAKVSAKRERIESLSCY